MEEAAVKSKTSLTEYGPELIVLVSVSCWKAAAKRWSNRGLETKRALSKFNLTLSKNILRLKGLEIRMVTESITGIGMGSTLPK